MQPKIIKNAEAENMPIKIPDNLPAAKTLSRENIFVMTEKRAVSQDIRPLKILLLNLMPNKIETETQILRLLSNTPIQVDVELLQTVSHTPKNTSTEHMLNFYKSFDEIKNNRYDGMIITGAPLEHLEFEQVDFWEEFCLILDWAKKNVYSTFFICWGAQAGLYHYYGIKKHMLGKKISGVYEHTPLMLDHPLLRGFDDTYFAPHSRYTGISQEAVKEHPQLDILSVSKQAGIHIIASHDCRRFFITGHSEYNRDTLLKEYLRDTEKGIDPDIPENYFPQNMPDKVPPLVWGAHASLLFGNWLNYFVYQRTPFDLSELIND